MRRTACPKSIYLIAAMGFIASSLALNISESTAATSSRPILTQADFKYLGAFLIPDSLQSGADTGWGHGLTHRYVNGQLRLMASGYNPDSVYEMSVPTPSLTQPLPQATVIREWGDIWHGKRTTSNSDGITNLIGLYWDETDKRLYWSYYAIYTVYGNDPSLGYSTLNDTTGGSTAYGPWGFGDVGGKVTMGCVLPIPQWFATAYTGGGRLAAGCGGPQSSVSNGPVSMGPALVAFSPSNLNATNTPSTPLVGYPYSSVIYGPPDRAHRDTNYDMGGSSSWMGWLPRNGVGYWTDGDWLGQDGVWIDLPDKQGVVFFPTLVNGHFWYESSTIWGDGGSHEWMVYDPADLAQIAQGSKQQWEIQPTNRWLVQYPGISYPLPSWHDMQDSLVTGVTFDPSTKRLYVFVRFHTIYVYEVQAASDTSPPSAPSALRVR